MLDDGVYGLSFAAIDGDRARGDGIAVLRGGQILGSDAHGGLFKGSYRFDAARGGTVVEAQLAVPPHGVLVTGYAAGSEGAFVDIHACFAPDSPASSAVIDVAGMPVSVELRYVGRLGRR
jgi:hypothetical protein